MCAVLNCIVFKASDKISGIHFSLCIIQMQSQPELTAELLSTCLMGGKSWLSDGIRPPGAQLLQLSYGCYAFRKR